MDANSKALNIHGLNKAHPLLDFERIIQSSSSVELLRFGMASRNTPLRRGNMKARPLALICLALSQICPAVASESRVTSVPIRQPAIRSVFPLGGQAGQTVALELAGDFLDPKGILRCECDDVTGTIDAGNVLSLNAKIQLSSSARPGPRIFYLETSRGTSNPFLFRVTGWPSEVEREPNNRIEEAQELPVPSVVEGRVARLTDTDFFRFRAKAGEKLAFNVMTARSKAAGHVTVSLLTAEGRRLAHNHSTFGTDPYLSYEFKDAGSYLLAVTARRFADFFTVVSDDSTINWQYQLAVGRSPMLWSLFPLGGKRGSTVEATLRADFLDPHASPVFAGSGISASLSAIPDPCACKFKMSIQIAPDAEPGIRYLSFPDESGNLSPLAFAISDTDEILEVEPNNTFRETQKIKLPVIINGETQSAGDRDNFQITVDQDDSLTFAVDARGLGSFMTDPNLALVRVNGETTGFGDDRCEKCPSFYNAVGKKEKLDSKFSHTFISANPNDADASGEYVLQLLDNSMEGGEGHGYRLLIRRRQPGFRVGVGAGQVSGPCGGAAKVPVVVSHEEGFKGKISITLRNLPSDLVAKSLTIGYGEESAALEIEQKATGSDLAACSQQEAKIEVVATAEIDGKQVSQVAALPPLLAEDGPGYNEIPRTEVRLRFVEPPMYSLDVEEPFRGFVLDFNQGNQLEFPVMIKRAKGFDVPVKLEVENLPEGLELKLLDKKEDGKLLVTLVGDRQKAKAGRYRLALKGLADTNGHQSVEFTRGFGIAIKQ
jgi:hypothetical protein